MINNFFLKLNKIHFYKFKKLKKIHQYYNNKINLISKKSLKNFYKNHIEHSLSIIKIIKFLPNSEIMDAGTGGGFPGIPLAIIFPNAYFYLIDSKKKKIKIIKKIIKYLKIKNIKIINKRIENYYKKFDFIVARYLTNINNINNLLKKNIKKKSTHYINNGIIYLTGYNKNFNNNYKIFIINKKIYNNKIICYIPFK
ncbi:MAG: 16S rRNA (guanine(527)-N(7))-methyltransferase RsmG [Candidatus Shikimatogenerans bostrichidophilus]|nr:MAG: 16S rRNA (guanine(527)-N(7))-methyltransferase RsmG [Candidatus Shikimatogenerans bostrichidophilus]